MRPPWLPKRGARKKFSLGRGNRKKIEVGIQGDQASFVREDSLTRREAVNAIEILRLRLAFAHCAKANPRSG